MKQLLFISLSIFFISAYFLDKKSEYTFDKHIPKPQGLAKCYDYDKGEYIYLDGHKDIKPIKYKHIIHTANYDQLSVVEAN